MYEWQIHENQKHIFSNDRLVTNSDQSLENTEQPQKELVALADQQLDLTTSIPFNPVIEDTEKKQESFSQIEQLFSDPNSLQGSLTQIQSNLQSDQTNLKKQSSQEIQLKSENLNQIQSSLSDFKLTDQFFDSNTCLTKSIPFLPQNNQSKSNLNQEENKQDSFHLNAQNISITNSNTNTNSSSITTNTSSKLSKLSTSSIYSSQNKKIPKKALGVNLQNRVIFPVNNLVSSTLKLSNSTYNQASSQKPEKVLRLLKKDIMSINSINDSCSTYTSIPNINDEDSSKIYESNQVSIDENDDLESKIHAWLDQEDVHITCPSSKMHDYYDNIRKSTIRDINYKILSGEDLDCYPTPGSTSSFNHLNHLTESPLPFTPTPLIERRNPGQLTTLLPACSFLNRRRLTQKIEDKKPKEIEEDCDEWDQD